MSRTLAREDAFKLIFEMELTDISAREALDYLYDTAENTNEMWAQQSVSAANKAYLEKIVSGIEEKKDYLNEKIAPLLKKWTLNRLSKVNLSSLKLAFFEIEFMEDIPYKVTANETVKIAKKYGGDESGAFVNGVIGTYLNSLDKKGE